MLKLSPQVKAEVIMDALYYNLHPVPLNAQIVLAKIVVQHAKSKLRAN
ncbi:hypothetical protein NXX68_05440 [Bacteroides fragilis]|jgi:hypothetical protein|nr:hypothetical protein [Bacteroides fragilis]MCS2221805.1 hypothetical protein [Bacteroides fragilis]MCS2488411.1 hypothetical protein [Bacteroides fragilis]UVQ85022.1 hypothetical protein NXW03_05410 [Bacteroides fragilis]UVR19171.1 hypothetical protein NXX17_05540 [Bacteroides fragilis]